MRSYTSPLRHTRVPHFQRLLGAPYPTYFPLRRKRIAGPRLRPSVCAMPAVSSGGGVGGWGGKGGEGGRDKAKRYGI